MLSLEVKEDWLGVERAVEADTGAAKVTPHLTLTMVNEVEHTFAVGISECSQNS